ncbi:hypothetical protein [Paenibacillus cremeus]|uniref:Uncharacterized protein n=1 Tax=Paenibacillus cremeus TaxID=2163881 RepID=A0A559KE73_9BACL|nr:hypothetical protein [Paenibacillus cremeus]TVY10432.1 hypothetical protein FPZ49_08535 [Paenibacillus cremeus]
MFQGGSLWAGLIRGSMLQAEDTKNLQKGQMNKTDYAVETTGNVTGAIGVMAGVEYGAVLGTTFMPGVGTVIGAVAGGILGDKLGRTVGHQVGSTVFHSQLGNKLLKPAVVDPVTDVIS